MRRFMRTARSARGDHDTVTGASGGREGDAGRAIRAILWSMLAALATGAGCEPGGAGRRAAPPVTDTSEGGEPSAGAVATPRQTAAGQPVPANLRRRQRAMPVGQSPARTPPGPARDAL